MILPTVFLAAQLAMPVADGVPTYDVRPSCTATSTEAVGPKAETDVCLNTEKAARDKLVQEWPTFAAPDRSTCTGLSVAGGDSTYTELLTCLEMMQAARKLPKEPDATIGAGTR